MFYANAQVPVRKVSPVGISGIVVDKDKDKDGIDDRLETWLLERYSPYFKFSSGESIFPIDAADYISQCDFKLCGSAVSLRPSTYCYRR